MTRVLRTVRLWGETVKFSHSVFALPFSLIAAFLAGRAIPDRGVPYIGQVLLVVVCMVAARSVAMTFNRIADARIDSMNPRTASRPIPSGRLSLSAAWLMFALFAIVFAAACGAIHVIYSNPWPLRLCVPILIYLCGYSYAKRFTRWSHFYLGSTLALAPLCAWIVINPASVGWPVVVMMLTVVCWVSGFDIIYACQDIDVDREQGLYSLPARLSPAAALWITRTCHVLTVVGLVVLGLLTGLGWLYWAGVVLAAGLLLIENSLVRVDDYRRVNAAFFTANGLLSVMLSVAAITDILWR